jgi:hypothetical protein
VIAAPGEQGVGAMLAIIRWRDDTRALDGLPAVKFVLGLSGLVRNGSGGRTRTYDQAVNSRPLYH